MHRPRSKRNRHAKEFMKKNTDEFEYLKRLSEENPSGIVVLFYQVSHFEILDESPICNHK